MITKRLFLASSSELQEDRKEFEIFINRKNKDWVARDVFLELVVWEDFLDAVSSTRLQDEYNQAIRECDIFVMLFWTKVGRYTEEEFETAFGQLKATNKPFIFTYFKDAQIISIASANKNDLMSLWAFQEKLSALGHFYTRYKNVDELNLKFNQQLDKLAAKGFVEFDPEEALGAPSVNQTVHGPQTNISGGEQRGPVLSGEFSGPVDFSTHHHDTIAPIDAEKAEAAERAEKIYREQIAERCGTLPLQSVDVSASCATAEPLSLAQVYIDLDTRRGTSGLNAVVRNRRLVLLGDPGSGKSTFVNHLTHALAKGAWGCLPEWPQEERDVLPIRVILREFARWVSAQQPLPKASPKLLWDFIVNDLKDWRLDAVTDRLAEALEKIVKKRVGGKEEYVKESRAVVLLDGLDEVPADNEDLLKVVRDSVAAFIERYDNTRHLVTCRVLSYQETRWQLPASKFPDVELAPFDEEKIDRFIDAWYAEVGETWQLAPKEIKTLADKLHTAVRRPDLWRLAPNPLLLTMMALVHSRRKELPEKRAVLYLEAVDTLLQHWEKDKTINAPQIQNLLDEVDRDFNDLMGVLEELAFDTHARGDTSQSSEDSGSIGELSLLKGLAALHPNGDYGWAQRLLESVRLRASLLLERKGQVFSFPHRTFQEYLAGVHLARQEDFEKQVMRVAVDSSAYWREVILLAVGYLVHNNRNTGKPRLLVEELCPECSPETIDDWFRVRLAWDVLGEIGINRVQDTEHGQRLLYRVRKHLMAPLEPGVLTVQERAKVGDMLGEVGDPRFDPDFFYLPFRYRGEPEPLAGFVEIPAGPFVMGEGKQKQQLAIDYVYWIARYPVTVAQYGAFVAAGGDAPHDWNAQKPFLNRPVTGISWHDAMAYCQWLDQALRRSRKVGPLRDDRYSVRLPTEAEWEKAARGGDAREYPWGDDDWDEERANIRDSKIGHPTPVGMYPKGATATTAAALHDLAGNVWEWTLGHYRDYPYRPEDGRNDPNAGARVLRGGSWYYDLRLTHCAYRVRRHPDNRDLAQGFRVVLSLADAELLSC